MADNVPVYPQINRIIGDLFRLSDSFQTRILDFEISIPKWSLMEWSSITFSMTFSVASTPLNFDGLAVSVSDWS